MLIDMLKEQCLASPFEERVLSIIEHETRRAGGLPVSTVAISVRTGSVPPRTVRWWLAKMEEKGLVRRPSPKGGWLPSSVSYLGASP